MASSSNAVSYPLFPPVILTQTPSERVGRILCLTARRLAEDLGSKDASGLQKERIIQSDGWAYDLSYRCYHILDSSSLKPIKLQFPFYTPVSQALVYANPVRPGTLDPASAYVKICYQNAGTTRKAFVAKAILEAEGVTEKALATLFASEAMDCYVRSTTRAAVQAVDFWDEWIYVPSPERQFYQEVIYPKVQETVMRLAKELGRLKIVDLGSSDGRLAKQLLDQKSLNDSIERYTLMDISSEALAAADHKLLSHSASGKIKLVPGDCLATAISSRRDRENRPNLVLACGFFTEQVFKNKEEATTVLRDIHDALTPGGYAIISSVAASYLRSRDYRAMGFYIHSLHHKHNDRSHSYVIIQKIGY